MPKNIKQELSRHSELVSESQKEIAQLVRDDMVTSHPERSEGSLKEIAQGVDSCESLPVPLRDDMAFRHPGGRRPLLDLESTQDFSRHPRNKFGAGSELDSGSINGERSPHMTTCHRAFIAQSQSAAFTLAEVLITLAIIGVVAALTIPSLIENHNEKAWQIAKDLWQKKLVEATRQMNIDGVMTGVAQTTEDYMDIFKKYVKVIKTCDNNKLKNCYAPKIVQTAGDEVEVSGLKTSNSLGQKWNTNTMGFVIADGTTVIMAYNPNCDSVDPFSKEGQNGQVGCMSMMIDVNGKKGPNKVGADIMLSNASISSCDMSFADLCLAGSDIYPITPINTCSSGTEEDQAYDDRGDSNKYCSTNYWAGAKKACDALDMRLPTMQELADIATYIYKQEDKSIGAKEDRSNISPDSDRASDLSWSANGWSYWSSESNGNYSAYGRGFGSSDSGYGSLSVGQSSGLSARCVKS